MDEHKRVMASGTLDNYNEDEREAFEFTPPFVRELSLDDPRLPYRSSKGQLRITLHHGQRKLLLSEIEFLTKYGWMSKNVIYAGAAPGIHIPFLSNLFPSHCFYLYDPAKFAIGNSPRINIFRQYFTDETAQHISNLYDDVLFICDIRRPDDDPQKFEENVLEDMQMQMQWTQIMNPEKAMLKFRFPYHITEIEYLDGRLFYQAWAPVKSGETRLIVDRNAEKKMYSLKDYEDVMYRFNTITRQQVFNIDINIIDHPKRPYGFDACYDCSSEVWILSRFLGTKDPEAIIKLMNKITTYCHQPLDRGYHGLVKDKRGFDRMILADTFINGQKK
jgi:cap2 methyltransferase